MELLERDRQLETLRTSLAESSGGAGGIVLVSGEAGIGKTSLLERFAADVRSTTSVLWGGCVALFTPHPLAPLHDMVRETGGELPAAIAKAKDRVEIFHTMLDHLSRMPGPQLLVFEDVHWADEATLDFIKFLGRRIQRLPALLVISFRDEEVGPFHPLRSVLGDLPAAATRRMQLPPLTQAAVEMLERDAGRYGAGLYEATGGNPFFVTEALCASEAAVPATVRDAVIARISRLSEPARAIARVAALVPREIERWLLDAIVGTDRCALEECLRAGMVAREQAIAFRHELARRAVEDDEPLPARQELHGRILAALVARDDDSAAPARLLYHADKAGDSEAVQCYAERAASEATALGAHREAASHWTIAARHADALCGDDRALLFERLSYECYLTDQIQDAIRARHSALALWRSSGNKAREGDNLRWLSRLYWFSAEKDAADRYANEAVQLLETLGPSRELAMAYSNLSQMHMLADESELALLWGEKAFALAAALGDTEIESHAQNNVGTAKLTRMDPSGRADLERSLQLALTGRFDEHAARAYCNLVSTAIRRRDYAVAHEYLAKGIAYCEDRDLDSWGRYLVAFRAEAALAQGEWQRAADDADVIAGDHRVAAVTRVQALSVIGRIRARRGDPAVDAPLKEARQLARASGELQRQVPVAAARAEAAWLHGDFADVVDELVRVYEEAELRADRWLKDELAYWLWRAGRLQKPPVGSGGPFMRQIEGNWKQAAREWEALGCPYERAMALAESKDEAALRTALQIFEQLGAAPMAGRTRRKLRSIGVRRIPRGAQERTKRNPHSLTRRELQVLGLIAEGERNADIARRLFVSEKTVDHHVSAVLAKLQVRSRSEAAVVATRLGLRGPEPRLRAQRAT